MWWMVHVPWALPSAKPSGHVVLAHAGPLLRAGKPWVQLPEGFSVAKPIY